MSWAIQITQAKPNPAGKDAVSWLARQEQLLGEWADLKNTGTASVRLSTLHLCNAQFSYSCTLNKESVPYWKGREADVLGPGQTVRVHTGKSAYSAYMGASDGNWAFLHAFAESGNYVLNNRCGDILSVIWMANDGRWTTEDKVAYAPYPGEGRILVRQGNMLV